MVTSRDAKLKAGEKTIGSVQLASVLTVNRVQGSWLWIKSVGGWINRDDVVLLDRAIEVAANWGRWAQVSRQATKQLLDAASTTFMETQLEFERVAITAASLTPDFAEGVSAFLEKREPNFSAAEEE